MTGIIRPSVEPANPSEVTPIRGESPGRRVIFRSQRSVHRWEDAPGFPPLGRRNMTLLAQFARYQRARGFSPATLRRRRSTLTAFAAYLEPSTLEHAELADVEQWLSTFGHASTRKSYRSDLRMFYAWATARSLIAANPTTLVDPIKVPRSLPRPLDIAAVLPALIVGTRRARRQVALGLFAGLRVAEIAALDAADVAADGSPPMLTVRLGKGAKDRAVPLHPILADLLRDLPSGPVFPSRTGGPVRPDSVSRTIRQQLERVGVTATAHQLRHTFGTEAARASGGDLRIVAALMGHAHMNTTMGYVALSGDETARVVASMFDHAAAA